MRAVTAVLAVFGLLGVVAASTPAKAHDFDDDDGGWRRQAWREHQWQEQHWREHEWRERARESYAPPPVVYAPPGYYAPAPAYYPAPPPAYYAVPPRAYYAPPPPVYSAPGFSIGFGFR